MPDVTSSKLNIVTLVIIALILGVMAFTAYRTQQQTETINKIIAAQTPLLFAFDQPRPDGSTSVLLVICDLSKDRTRYTCKTEQVKQ